MAIVCNILNASEELNDFKDVIQESFDEVIPVVQKDLGIDSIDVIFLSASGLAIPELGVSGFSPGPNHIYIYIDPNSDKLSKQNNKATLFHEFHHAARWREPGYGNNLGEAIITEGLACVYEEEKTGTQPIYTKMKLRDELIERAREEWDSNNYDHNAWFYGNDNIDKWFGYAYGYKIVKNYCEKTDKSSQELVNTPAKQIK